MIMLVPNQQSGTSYINPKKRVEPTLPQLFFERDPAATQFVRALAKRLKELLCQ